MNGEDRMFYVHAVMAGPFESYQEAKDKIALLQHGAGMPAETKKLRQFSKL